MTTATAPDPYNFNAVNGVFSAVFNQLNPAMGAALDITGIGANLTTPPLRIAYDKAAGVISSGIEFAKLSPEEMVDKIISTNPKLASVHEAMESDPVFKQSVMDAAIKDDTFLPVVAKLSNNDSGSAFLSSFGDSLKNPEFRGRMTNMLTNLAERDDIKGAHFEELANSGIDLTADPMSTEKRDRFIKAQMEMGATEADAVGTIQNMEKDFWKNILNEPERLGGWLGSIVQGLNIPGAESIGQFLAAIIPDAIKMVGGIPEFFKDWMGPEWAQAATDAKQGLNEYNKGEGQTNINNFSQTFG